MWIRIPLSRVSTTTLSSRLHHQLRASNIIAICRVIFDCASQVYIYWMTLLLVGWYLIWTNTESLIKNPMLYFGNWCRAIHHILSKLSLFMSWNICYVSCLDMRVVWRVGLWKKRRTNPLIVFPVIDLLYIFYNVDLNFFHFEMVHRPIKYGSLFWLSYHCISTISWVGSFYVAFPMSPQRQSTVSHKLPV